MKSFTDLFIRRPVLALVVNLVILIAGFQAIRTLVVRQYPRSDNAMVTVTTTYVGASAELVRGFITTPLERAIAGADGATIKPFDAAKAKHLRAAHLSGEASLADVAHAAEADTDAQAPTGEPAPQVPKAPTAGRDYFDEWIERLGRE